MLEFETGNKDEPQGRAAIYSWVTDSYAPSCMYGSFLTVELSDIISQISKKFENIEEDLKKVYDLNRENLSNVNSKISFYSVGLDLVSLSDLRDLRSDFCCFGHHPSFLYEEYAKALDSYINDFLIQNFSKTPPVKDLETSINLQTKIKSPLRIFVRNFLIPYDHYSQHRGEPMRYIILNDYIAPMRRAINQRIDRLADEIINRFRHFTDDPDLAQAREDLIEVVKNIDSHLNDYRLYLDLFVSLIDENYEKAAKIKDNISKFELNKIFNKMLNTNDTILSKE